MAGFFAASLTFPRRALHVATGAVMMEAPPSRCDMRLPTLWRQCLTGMVLMFLLFTLCPGASAQPAAGPPAILFTDISSGPTSGGPGNLGVPIAIFGTGFGATRGTSQVRIGGVEVAAYLVWGTGNASNPALDMVVVQPGAAVTGGVVSVTVGGRTSASAVTFTPNGGRIRYVATTGSDAAACSETAPCATIGHAIEPAVSAPGDTILVRGGMSTEGEIWIRREYGHGGTLVQRKTIKAYPGETVTFTNGSRPFIVDADYITVAGFRFENGKSLGIPDAGDANRRRGVRLINNSLIGPVAWAFIDTHGDDHVVAGNRCDATGSSVGTQGHCYYISYGDNVRVQHNVGGGAPGYGIHVFDQQRSASDFRRVISRLIVEGNTLRGSSERSGLILAMNDEGGLGNLIDGAIIRNNVLTGNNHLGVTLSGNVRGVRIVNNTFVENGRQGLYVGAGTALAAIEVRNNLFVQSVNTVCQLFCSWYAVAHIQVEAAAASAVTVSGNAYGPGGPGLVGTTDTAALNGAVTFVAPARLDFHVRSGVTIDRGAPLSDVPVDADGISRPQGAAFDIGAFELPADERPPVAPRNVRIVRP